MLTTAGVTRSIIGASVGIGWPSTAGGSPACAAVMASKPISTRIAENDTERMVCFEDMVRTSRAMGSNGVLRVIGTAIKRSRGDTRRQIAPAQRHCKCGARSRHALQTAAVPFGFIPTRARVDVGASLRSTRGNANRCVTEARDAGQAAGRSVGYDAVFTTRCCVRRTGDNPAIVEQFGECHWHSVRFDRLSPSETRCGDRRETRQQTREEIPGTQ